MKKLSIKSLIEFRGKSARGKKAFAESIKSNKITPPNEGGGDYWITSLSAIYNSYRQGSLKFIDDKIIELDGKFSSTKRTLTKNMYQRNITILEEYKNIDLKRIRPNEKLAFLKRSSANHILSITGLQIEVKASHTFIFGSKNEEKAGAIWFIAKVKGYRVEEVGMFCEMLYRFLNHNYSKKYQLMPKYCIAVDVVSGNIIDYSMIKDGAITRVLTKTLDEINALL